MILLTASFEFHHFLKFPLYIFPDYEKSKHRKTLLHSPLAEFWPALFPANSVSGFQVNLS